MTIAFLTASLCYLSIFIWLLYCLYYQKKIHRKFCLAFLSLALMTHTFLLYPSIITPLGLNFNVFNVISLSTVFLLLFFLLFTVRHPIISLALLAAPTGFIGLTAGYFGQSNYEPVQNMSIGLQVHILLSIAAYSMLLMAAVQAVIVRLQIRELKHETQQRLWVSKLPSLQKMERLLFDMIVFGFGLLSIALVLGLFYVDSFFIQHLTHKSFFSLLSWVVFANLLFGHWRYGWRGRRAANFTLYGFALLAIGFVGSKIVLELILK